MVATHLGLLLVIDFADLTLGMLFLHAFTFDPAWLRGTAQVARVHYDGNCALCHGFLRFLLSEGPAKIRFKPLENPEAKSVLVETQEGKYLE